MAANAAASVATVKQSVPVRDKARHPDSAIRRAIALLPSGLSVPVEVVDTGLFRRHVRARVERSCTFVLVGLQRIYVNDACPVYLNAERGMLDTIKLAALLRHEEAHLHGADEAEARRVEVATFRTLLRKASAEYQTPGMVYAATLDRLAHARRQTRSASPPDAERNDRRGK
jgi:hypothetical protein